MKGQTVYVAFRGDYSLRGAVGVYSTRIAAEAVAECWGHAVTGNRYCDIEEFTLDAPPEEDV